MFFYTAKILWLLIQPSHLLVLAIVFGALALLLGRQRVAAWLIGPAAAVLVLISFLPVGQWLLLPLENRFPQPQMPERIDGVVMLGGVVDKRVTVGRGQVALNQAAERFTALIELGLRYPEARLVFAGGQGFTVGLDYPEAAAMRRFCVAQRFPCERILLEDRSRDTYENALFAKALAEPRPDERWVLVTSAAHMPRAVGVFRRAGWEVLPYPVDYLTAPVPSMFPPDVAARLVDLDLAFRHWLGLLAYWATDRTDALWPAP